MLTPHACGCTTCGGNGLVPSGFYSKPLGQLDLSQVTATETCRPCRGTGIVWYIIQEGVVTIDPAPAKPESKRPRFTTDGIN